MILIFKCCLIRLFQREEVLEKLSCLLFSHYLLFNYSKLHTYYILNCIHYLPLLLWSRVNSGSIVSDYGLDDRAIGFRSPAEAKDFFPLASVSRPALGPTQPPVQWVPGVLSPEVKRGRGVTLTTHPHLVPRSWISRSYISSPPKRLHGV
jgi:hypothetical protein